MPATNPILQVNRALADKLLDQAKQNPSAFAGKFVGIANGQVIVVTDDLNEMVRRLEKAEPNSANTFWVEIGRDYSKICEIWKV